MPSHSTELPDPEGSPALTELLENAAWLRGVAQQMIGDGRDGLVVDDAMQETWLAALRAGPRQRSSAKAWMSTVVRNFGRQRYRGEARRRAREEEAGREEALPSPVEIQAKMELTEQLARFVRELPEPYRRTLVLRFYEERSPSWIAEAEKVSVRTVETRLRRGIDKLRVAFEREHVDSREHWLGSLVLIAYGPSRVADPKPLVPLFGGKGVSVLALVLTVLTVVGVLVRLGGGVDRTPRLGLAPPVSVDEDLGLNRSELATPGGNGRLAASLIEEELPEETRWHGHLVDAATGAPLGGVKVGLYTRDRDEHIPMRSGPLGNVCTAWDLELGPTRAHIEATETTRAIKLSVEPPVEGQTNVQNLVIPRRGGGVMGQCLDVHGAPVSEARVLAWRVPISGALRVEEANRSIRCDEEGRFWLRDLAGERGNPSRVVLMALTEDLCTREPFELTVRSASTRSGVELVMATGWRVEGQVVLGERGKEPGAGARLEIPFPNTAGLPARPGAAVEQEVRTGLYWESNATANGRFSFLLPPVPSTLAVAVPGFVRQEFELRGDADYFVRMLSGAMIRGRVTDEGGLPLEGIVVRLVERDRVLMQESDERGEFQFGGIEIGSPVALVAGVQKRSRYAPAHVTTEALDALFEPTLVLSPEERLEGTVLGPSGEPLGGVMVTVHGRVPLLESLDESSSFGAPCKKSVFDQYHVRTDARGRFSIGGLWPGTFELTARRFRKGKIIARTQASTDEPLGILRAGDGLDNCATLRGRASYADGEPVEHWRLEAHCRRADGRRDFFVFRIEDPSGRYEISGLPPGEVTLEAYAERPREARLRMLRQSVSQLQAGPLRLDFTTVD